MGTEMRAILVCRSIDEQDTDGISITLTVRAINVHTVMRTRFVVIIEVKAS